MMHKNLWIIFAISALALVSCSSVSAKGQHHIYATVNSDEIGEACPELQAGQTLSFNFESTKSAEFNLHYHEGDEVTYPVEPQSLMEITEDYKAPIDQTYCLMWKGLKDNTKVQVKYRINN